MNLKTPAMHGGRPDDYYYVISGKKGTKTYYSNILDCKIAKGEIDKAFINEIKERPSCYDNYKAAVQLIDKRSKLEEKLNLLKNQVAAINDQLTNMNITTPEEELGAATFLTKVSKEKAARKEQFNAERDDIIREVFKSNGWEYHGYPTGINPNAQKHPVKREEPFCETETPPRGSESTPEPKPYAPKPTDYKPSRGNFNYHDDEDSWSEETYIPSSYINSRTNACKSKFSYAPEVLVRKNITTKKEWLKWLLENHVDRGGDQHICSEVISAGRSKGW